MTDTYQNWIERVVGGRNAKPLSSGEIVKSSSGEPFGPIEFVRVEKQRFLAEVGKKGDTYIYHFFPAVPYQPNPRVNGAEVAVNDIIFSEALSGAFIEVFKREDQIEMEWVDEMKAWAVRVRGWTDHVWGDDLALRAIHRVDELLRGDHQ